MIIISSSKLLKLVVIRRKGKRSNLKFRGAENSYKGGGGNS